MQLNVGVRAKQAILQHPKLAIRNQQLLLVESSCTTIVLQLGLQVEPLWPPASCCTGPLKPHLVELEPY